VADAAERARRAFDLALADDLNTPEALAAVHGLVNDGNGLLADGAVTSEGAGLLRAQLQDMDRVFGVLLPDEERLAEDEQRLFEERQEARRRRDFKRADELRVRLEALGILLEDTPKGTRWRRRR
jgi:cysteinyl-tRNA synthetase